MFKKIYKYFIFIFLITGQVLAQNNIIGYQYAFNNGDNLTYVPITPTTDFHLQTDLDVSSLTNAINQIHIRFKDSNGQWSGIVSQMFLTNPQTANAQDVKITGYEYFFNDDVAGKQFVSVSQQDNFHLIDDLDVSSLTNAINQIHIRFKDSNGQWSGIVSQMFLTNPQTANAQDVKITGYEYYYNNDVAGKQFVSVPAQDNFHLIDDLDVSSLTNAINQIHVRFKDSNGQWSSIVSQMFLTNPQTANTQDVKITGYEYYYNDDIAGKQFVSVPAQDNFHLIDDLDVSNLTNAINQIHVRFRDSNGQWSGIVSQMFLTNPQTANVHDVKIIGYEYYYNNDAVNRQFVSVSSQDNFHLIDDLDVSSLPNTINQIHVRFLDDNGQWSSMLSKTFMRNPDVNVLTDNKLVSYEYWVDDDTANMQTMAVQPPIQDLHILDLDMRMYWRGQHVLHSRYKDAQGVYSLVTTDTIVKLPMPYPLFDMNASEICPGESVDFTNNSVDYDTVLWNFGDGTTSTDINPTHTFTQSGTYQVNLHITETTTGQTADLQQNLTVNPLPASSVSSSSTFPACFGETVSLTADATGMNYLWSTGETSQSIDVSNAGTYSVQITNPTTGCAVTSNDVNVSYYPEIDGSITYDAHTYQLTANQTGATYQWLDCDDNNSPISGATNQSFTPQESGNYAVEISLNNCSVISDCQQVTIVGISNNSLDKFIDIYPNPAKQFVVIKTELPGLQLQLYTMDGQSIWRSQKLNTKTNQIDISRLSSGMYYIRLKVLSGIYQNKVINKKLIVK